MADDLDPLREDEALLVPVDLANGLALVAGIDAKLLGKPEPVSRSLVDRFLQTAGYAGGANAARRLTDGSLVRLAPETMRKLNQGATLAQSKSVALGVLRDASGKHLAGPVRLLPGAANPVAAGMLIQTMALQRQLQGIQESLQRIDAKIEALHKAQHHNVLAEVLAMGGALEEIRQKLATGAPLSREDENQLRSLEVSAQTHRIQARLWIKALEPLFGGRRVPLSEQLETLTDALGDSHVGFWVRAAVASDVVLIQTLALKVERAAVAEELDWAHQLHDKAQKEIVEVGHGLHALHSSMDRYLRRNDIARGFEELSVRRKGEVRRLRRDLWDVMNGLRDAIHETKPMLEAAIGSELPALPAPLDRRAIEPHVVRDNAADAAAQAQRAAARWAKVAGRGANRGVRRIVRSRPVRRRR